jgi:branched-chain amino acid transport system ATP-binding protein
MSLLQVEHVVVQFGGVTAVDDASFEVEPATITGLIGPNGAGKTTCFNVISGLQRPTRGKVRFRGHDVTSLSVDGRARRGMGRTFQRLEAFGSLSVRENVMVALDINRGLRGMFRNGSKDADALLERVGIASYADDRADSVPTGTARLLELARALACEPRLLLLDEPCAGLSPQETAEVIDVIRWASARRRATIVVIEHDMSLVRKLADHVFVLHNGRLLAQGSVAEVQADAAVQAVYVGAEK